MRVDLKVPDAELVASRESDDDRPHEDVYVVIRDAFDAVRRRLEDNSRRRRGETKRHEPQAHGRVVELFPEAGYGTIETSDGHHVYFHERSVLKDAFGSLAVRLIEEPGEHGPQVSTVQPVGKHHPVG